jgi:2-phosphosulfolactate phosphatase
VTFAEVRAFVHRPSSTVYRLPIGVAPVFYDQSQYAVRVGWGLRGLQALSPHSDVVVIVDVLSFTTSVDVATSLGAQVYPYGWRDGSPEAYAREKKALLASKRPRPGVYSLSPTSLLDVKPGTRLVLPSPNGSTLSIEAAKEATTIAGCLRNARAVASFAQAAGRSIAVIACGERWRDTSLRPALEDMIGAGAVISYLEAEWSPEAQAAVAVFDAARMDLLNSLKRCASGVELIEKGLEPDLELAAQLNHSRAVPVLQGDHYSDVRPT